MVAGLEKDLLQRQVEIAAEEEEIAKVMQEQQAAKDVEKQVAAAEEAGTQQTISRLTTQLETLLLEKYAKLDNALSRARELLAQPPMEYGHLTSETRTTVEEENTNHLEAVKSEYATFASQVAEFKSEYVSAKLLNQGKFEPDAKTVFKKVNDEAAKCYHKDG